MDLFWISYAWAEYEIPDHISIDMSIIRSLCMMILGAVAVVWVLRKLIKFINRS